MSRLLRSIQLLALLVLSAASTAGGQESLTIEGVGARTLRFTAAQLHALGGDTLRLELHHQKPATYAIVPLRRLLAEGGLVVDSLKGRQLTMVVIAEARDDYRVAISLGEMAKGLGGRDVVIAYRRDNAPLTQEEGPFRLIVKGDERAARSIRQLVRLRLVDAAAPTAAR
jgi:hypothetical protein